LLYQNIRTEVSPYQVGVGPMSGFREHRHADIEINYAIKGSFEATVNKKTYTINQGELLLISPMAAHSFPFRYTEGRQVLTLIVGVSFLKKFFSYFTHTKQDAYVINLDDASDNGKKLTSLLNETVELHEEKQEINELLVRGNIYKICAYLINIINDPDLRESFHSKEMTKVANIEKALDLIYYDYANPLTVNDAAELTGYGKSNFCKIFKKITGDTFHNALNRRRVESACALLSETDLSISRISEEVGFGETKSLCRVFRLEMGMTPLEYRKSAHISDR